MKLEERKLALQERQFEFENKKLEFKMRMREQSFSRSGSSSRSSRTPNSKFSLSSILNSSNMSSSQSPDCIPDYDSEVSLELKIRQAMEGGSMKEQERYMAKRMNEIAIIKKYRDRCREQLASEEAIVEANDRREELEYRKMRRQKNPVWHTDAHIKDRERKKALGRSQNWTREEFYKMKGVDDYDNEHPNIQRELYLAYDKYKRNYSAYGVSPGKASYKTVRSSDSDLWRTTSSMQMTKGSKS